MANIDGTSAGETLNGTADPDVIRGFGGNDTLNGQGGADRMEGGTGDDNYYVDNPADVIIELLSEGFDAVYAYSNYALGAGQEIEWLSAVNNASTDTIALVGNEFAQYILGSAGKNIMSGGGGADIMVGYGGDDVYYADTDDQIIESAGGGFDSIYVSTNYILAAGVDVEWLSATSNAATNALNLTGNEIANFLVGNNGSNILNGGAGADTMTGFGGNDNYYVDNLGDRVFEAAGGGFDAVYVFTSYALAAGQEIEWLSAANNGSTETLYLTGNEYSNFLLGNNGENLLNGGAGADIMTGYGGNDTYYVDDLNDRINEAVNGGFDAVYAFASYTLGAGQEIEWLSVADVNGTQSLNLTGNEFGNYLIGSNGANILDGGGGADVMTGGGGADTFLFKGLGPNDRITDFVSGTDKIVISSVAALATGALRAGTFVNGTAALDADDYLIYNSATGTLLFDADGNGAGAAIHVVTLGAGVTLTAQDIMVAGAANNAPVITSGATASVAENSAASTIVYQVAASDPDNNVVTYSLTGTDAGLLSIDANGAVRLLASADFEAKNSYSFNVVASDSAVATVKAVTLTITDVAEGGSTPIINETANANDTRQTAQVIDPGLFTISSNPNLPNAAYPSATIIGSISTPNDVMGVSTDVDFFAITLQAGQQLILDVDGTTTLDSFLTLYGPDGQKIGDNDDLISPDPGSGTQFGHNTDSQILFRAGVSGTYYFSISSFMDEDSGQPTSLGAYSINVSVNSTPATAAQIMAEDVQALISGSSWNRPNLTFGFPSAASLYPSSFEEVDTSPPAPNYTFEAFNATQQSATRLLLTMIANVTNLNFTELTGTGNYTVQGSAASADLRYAESSIADVAYAYYPTNAGPGSTGGSAWFNRTNFNNPVKGNYAWMGILHETGHALGLKHGHEFPLAISADHDSLEYSVMTYRSYPGGDVEGGYSNETFGYAQTLMMLDIAALQKIYGGADYGFNGGDSIYTWSSSTGEMFINGVGQGAPGANRIFMTVWDGGGNDTYDFSNYHDTNRAVTIDLRAGEWVDLDQQLANLGDGHFARGNIANALMYENNPASLIENAIGTDSGDWIVANQAANRLTGGGSADRFVYYSAADCSTSAVDTIMDFNGVGTGDVIDLSRIDANPNIAGDQAFTYIQDNAFHNVAGELRYQVIGGSAHIFGDIDGNGVADIEIILNNVTTVSHTDFFF